MARSMGVSLSSVVSAPICAVTDAITEQHMGWSDVIGGSTEGASRDQDAVEGGNSGGAESAPWDPYDVWLTRVKQPRELADRAVTARNSNRAWHRPRWIAGSRRECIPANVEIGITIGERHER